jgi:3D (Asp-Asp-Asp) domain-containing protein
MEAHNNHFIPKVIPALCLSAVFQFAACAQATSDGNKAPQSETKANAQPEVATSAKLVENSTPSFDYNALGTHLLCSPNALANLLKSAAASETPPVPVSEPKVQLPRPSIAVAVQPHEQKFNQVSFAQPEQDSQHAPRTFRATAYALKGRTRSGVWVEKGVIAADPRVLPLGTVVQVNAGKYSGVYTVHDTGGKIKGNRVDVWMPTNKEARRFGRRNVKLVVLRYPSKNKSAVKK